MGEPEPVGYGFRGPGIAHTLTSFCHSISSTLHRIFSWILSSPMMGMPSHEADTFPSKQSLPYKSGGVHCLCLCSVMLLCCFRVLQCSYSYRNQVFFRRQSPAYKQAVMQEDLLPVPKNEKRQ